MCTYPDLWDLNLESGCMGRFLTNQLFGTFGLKVNMGGVGGECTKFRGQDKYK